jgi:hypothetical protein
MPSMQGPGGLVVDDDKVLVIRPEKRPWFTPTLMEIDYESFAREHPDALQVSHEQPKVGDWKLVAAGPPRDQPMSYGC